MVEISVNIKKHDLHYVDPRDHTEVEYLHSKFPWIAEEKIISVIKTQGPERKHIEDYLERCHS